MDVTEISVATFRMGTEKEAALKPLEEAAEVYGAWQAWQGSERRGTRDGDLLPFVADEVADTIQACCNLAARLGIDLGAAMRRCEERNRARGRYDGTGA